MATDETAGPRGMEQGPQGSPSPSTGLIDIGANLLDPMFQGVYREKSRHAPDFDAVLRRACAAGVERILVTAGSLQEAKEASELCERADPSWPALACTVGVHPTRCSEFEEAAGGPDTYLAELLTHAKERGKHCVAVGECGLDYDRLEFCPKEVQLRHFERQLEGLAVPLGLPLFLHCRTRGAAADMLDLLGRYKDRLRSPPGVVHSFDGELEDARAFIELGFYIGLNGCSLRTAENLATVEGLPMERILLETDAPWCGIKATHASKAHVKTSWEEVKKPEKWEEGKCVKDRCEPCHLRQVLEVVAKCQGVSPERLAEEVHKSTLRVFFASA